MKKIIMIALSAVSLSACGVTVTDPTCTNTELADGTIIMDCPYATYTTTASGYIIEMDRKDNPVEKTGHEEFVDGVIQDIEDQRTWDKAHKDQILADVIKNNPEYFLDSAS